MRVIVTMACTECKRRNYTTREEQDERSRPDRDEEVLQVVPEAHPAPGDEVGESADAHRPVAQLVERRSPKPEVGGSSPSGPARLAGPRHAARAVRPAEGREGSRSGRPAAVAQRKKAEEGERHVLRGPLHAASLHEACVETEEGDLADAGPDAQLHDPRGRGDAPLSASTSCPVRPPVHLKSSDS